jgi:cold shock CspA family protein
VDEIKISVHQNLSDGDAFMATGTISYFDPVERYGFILPDDGSSKVLMHADDIGGDVDLPVGALVRFSSIQGNVCLKAYNVVVLDNLPDQSEGVSSDKSGIGSASASAWPPRAVCAESRCRYDEEIRSVLMSTVPSITAAQIAEVCRRLGQPPASAVGFGTEPQSW